MKCMVDAKSGIDKDAVAVCHDCGAGVCLVHVTQRHVVEAPTGMAGSGRSHTVYVCPTCHAEWPGPE
jgi:hypothetical protein